MQNNFLPKIDLVYLMHILKTKTLVKKKMNTSSADGPLFLWDRHANFSTKQQNHSGDAIEFMLGLHLILILQAVLVMKAIAACGSTPENAAKVIMIMNQLSKKGAQSRFIADALKHLADYDAKRAGVLEALTTAFDEEKLQRNDVFLNVRMCQAIENENEPTWKDVKNMKDILQGCSPSSPEGIELNLARATKVTFFCLVEYIKETR